MTLTDEVLLAIRNAHEKEYGQYCDQDDFLMVAHAIIARVHEELRKQEPVGRVASMPLHENDREVFVDMLGDGNDLPDGTFVYATYIPPTPTPTPTPSQQELIKSMVDRFLGWKLPKDFSPDNGVHFSKTYGGYQGDEFVSNIPRTDERWPVGTNLFSAEQATAMFEHCLAAPYHPLPPTQITVAAPRGYDP